MNKKISVALGNFDGVHKGHQKIFEKAKELGKTAVCFTFLSHPEKGDAIYNNETKEELIIQMGLTPYFQEFDEAFKNLSPEEFVQNILRDKLRACAVVFGENFYFGKNRAGDADLMIELCEKNGINAAKQPLLSIGGKTVSTTAIKEFLKNGEIENAADFLGREYEIERLVIKGRSLGATIGFPTINQKFENGLVMPKCGVYASSVTLGGKTYKSITNIGFAPTAGTREALSETHILGFSGNLYGEIVKVTLKTYLREEKKFSDMAELKATISQDAERAKTL